MTAPFELKMTEQEAFDGLKKQFGTEFTTPEVRAFCAMNDIAYATVTRKIAQYKVGKGKWNLTVTKKDVKNIEKSFSAPSVEPTGQSLCVALLERGDDRAAMGTRVEEYLDRAVFLAVHEHRLVANMCSIIISGVWYLAFVAQEIPDTLEAEFQFRIVNIRVLENRPVQAKFMIRLGTIVNAVGKIDNRPFIRHRAGSVDAICAEV